MENRGTGFEGMGMGGEASWGTAGTTGDASGSTGGTGELKDKAQSLGQGARRQAARRLDSKKGQLSDLLDRVAETMDDDELGGYAAGYVRRGAEMLRGRSTDELISAAGDQLRHRPAAVVGFAFLAGFAIARMARR
jgi:hypothetical protein